MQLRTRYKLNTYSNHRGRKSLASESYSIAIVDELHAYAEAVPIAVHLSIAVCMPMSGAIVRVTSIQAVAIRTRAIHAHIVAQLDVDRLRMTRSNPDDQVSAP